MNCRVGDLKYKDVINVVDGAILGCVNDIEIDTGNAKITSIIIHGKLKFFGILGREKDIIIPWQDINIIGEDAVLVRYRRKEGQKKRFTKLLPQLFFD